MIMIVLLVCVLMFYWQGRRPSKKEPGTSSKTVSPAPTVEHPLPEPAPPQLGGRPPLDITDSTPEPAPPQLGGRPPLDITDSTPGPAPPQLDDRRDTEKHRDPLVRWRRMYLFLALLVFLAAVVLLVWAAREVQCQDRAIFKVSVSVWLLLLAGIIFIGELTRRSLALAGISKLDDVDGA